MPRGTSLSEVERARIKCYHETGMQVCEISNRLKRHRNTIANFLKNCEQYGKTKRCGAKPKVTKRDIREIKRLAVSKSLSANQIKHELSLNITKRRVQQILSSDASILYRKRLAKPKLTPRHKRERLQFAEKYKFWDVEWKYIIFSDEKKWNLDGPDGFQKHWEDKRLPRAHRYSRNYGGGSIMTWAAFGFYGKSEMCFISHKMNAELYVELLDSDLIEFGENVYGESWTFQQDNAPIHNAKLTKAFFNERKIPVLKWPAISPDLNPLENLWAIISQNVYKNGRQFNTLKDLKKAVQEEWNNIDVEFLRNLINSMPNRMNEVILNNGGHTTY